MVQLFRKRYTGKDSKEVCLWHTFFEFFLKYAQNKILRFVQKVKTVKKY